MLNDLKLAGFSNSDISVLYPDENTEGGLEPKRATKSPEGAVTGASTGGIVGGVLGWLAGVGALAIPGLGAFIAAGPIMAALAGLGIGSAVGGLAGALIGLGIPEIEAKRYEEALRSGNILLCAHCENGDQEKEVNRIFKANDGSDICGVMEDSDEQRMKKQEKEIKKEASKENISSPPNAYVEDPDIYIPPSNTGTGAEYPGQL
jgi:hypothetical protein